MLLVHAQIPYYNLIPVSIVDFEKKKSLIGNLKTDFLVIPTKPS